MRSVPAARKYSSCARSRAAGLLYCMKLPVPMSMSFCGTMGGCVGSAASCRARNPGPSCLPGACSWGGEVLWVGRQAARQAEKEGVWVFEHA